MTDTSVQFLPFHAINEFMRPDFRMNLIRKTLTKLNSLPDQRQDKLNRLIKKIVKVPGFRNSDKAPTAVKIIPTAKAFETNPDLVAEIITAWTELHPALCSQVYQVLKQRGWYFFSENIKSLTDLPALKSEKDWGILPLEADRTRLPGFLIYWPQQQEFEAIYDTFTELFPNSEHSIDEVSLAAVWLSNRLPYHILDDEPETNSTIDEVNQSS